MSKFEFIEVGTSDFRTLAATIDAPGISIEPVKAYYDRLPVRDNLIRINKAISDTAKFVDVYWCDPEVIRALNLPNWLRGCNSIEIPHPTVKKWCTEKGVDYNRLVKKDQIECITLQELFDAFEVEEVNFLKIDTEGHDYYIVKHLFELPTMPLIHRIQYESNSLLSPERRDELLHIVQSNGYKPHTVMSNGQEDTILTMIEEGELHA